MPTVTCIPHFKDDADNPWVTKESDVLIRYWFNPKKTHNLLQIAESIEAWTQDTFQQNMQENRLIACCIRNYSIIICKMEIRGKSYDRQAFETLSTESILLNEEPFNMTVSVNFSACTIL